MKDAHLKSVQTGDYRNLDYSYMPLNVLMENS